MCGAIKRKFDGFICIVIVFIVKRIKNVIKRKLFALLHGVLAVEIGEIG